MAKILVAEDEISINQLITQNLQLVGHEIDQATDGLIAYSKLQNNQYDLVLLDVMMPGLSGFDIILKIKEKTPIIFVSAKTSLEDRIKGLGLGGEDYISKPFEMLELLARVQVVLRRNQKEMKHFSFADIAIDLETREVFKGDIEIDLTPKEFELLKTLLINQNIALSREKLLQLVWEFDYEGDTRTVDVHIQRLRKKLGLEEWIKTVYKMGYRLQIKDRTK